MKNVRVYVISHSKPMRDYIVSTLTNKSKFCRQLMYPDGNSIIGEFYDLFDADPNNMDECIFDLCQMILDLTSDHLYKYIINKLDVLKCDIENIVFLNIDNIPGVNIFIVANDVGKIITIDGDSGGNNAKAIYVSVDGEPKKVWSRDFGTIDADLLYDALTGKLPRIIV